MKQKIVIETRIEDLKDYDWLFYETDNEDIECINDDKSINKAAELWKMTPEAVKAIRMAFDYFAETLVDTLIEDLQDIWEVANDAIEIANEAIDTVN